MKIILLLLKNLFVVLKQLACWLCELVTWFWDLLGIDDLLQSKLVLYGMLIIASILGIGISVKRKNKLWTGICLVSELSSIVGAVFAARKSK